MIYIRDFSFFVYDKNYDIFLKGFRKYLPKFIKNIIIKYSIPQYEEYIRYIDDIEYKLEFFTFPDIDYFSRRVKKIIQTIKYYRNENIIKLSKGVYANKYILLYITYYILKQIFKKFGVKINKLNIGIIGIEDSQKNGLLYQLSNQVNVIYSIKQTNKFEKISEELLREFGVILVDAENHNNLQKICDIIIDFENICSISLNSVICDVVNNFIYDNLYTKKVIDLKDVKFNFNILKDISINNKYVFCDLNIYDISEICEKLLLQKIDNFIDAYEIFTKDYFDVKIPLL